MTTPPRPQVSRSRGIPLVWLVPIISLLAGGWLLIDEYRDHGPEITIEFEDGSGIEAGKTRLDYKGVAVGTVRNVSMKPDLSGVTVRLRINRSAAALASEGARFWVVQPEFGLGGVRGLDTILTGARLNVIPGNGQPTTHFTGLKEPPLPRHPDGGRSFMLQSDRLGSLNTGTPVFYREIKVGLVESSRLANDSASVRIRIHIDAPYVDLVRTNTCFWNNGGFSLKVGLFGAELRNTSLESLINGGIAFATPDTDPLAPPAPEGMQFELAREADKSWLKWSPKIPIQSPDTSPPPKPTGIAPLLSSSDQNDKS